MTSHRIRQLNAASTAVCALGMFAARGGLYPLFGLDGPSLLDALAVGLPPCSSWRPAGFPALSRDWPEADSTERAPSRFFSR